MDCDYCIQRRVESLRSESQVYWQPHDILLQAILLNANINDWKIDWNHTKCKICQMGSAWQSIVFLKIVVWSKLHNASLWKTMRYWLKWYIAQDGPNGHTHIAWGDPGAVETLPVTHNTKQCNAKESNTKHNMTHCNTAQQKHNIS